MHTLVKRHVMVAWIAMLGILFSAFAPAVSHAMTQAMTQATQADMTMQVCTMEGMKTIVFAPGTSGEHGPADHLTKHCPYCATHAGTGAFLPAARFVFALPSEARGHAPLFYQSPTPLFCWTGAKPRGPPA